jgi:hypothetical protein
MHRIMFSAALALAAMIGAASSVHAQTLLPTKDWGSLKGKVTLEGEMPAIRDLRPLMMGHADKHCCLDPKAKKEDKGELEQMWVIDPKTKGVANVMVWIKAPKDTFFPTHKNYLTRKDHQTIDQPHCAFLPRVSAFNPVRYDEKTGKLVATGQELVIKNSAPIGHNVRAIGHPKYNEGFNRNLPPKTELNAKTLNDTQKLNPQPLPLSIQCDIHTWMAAKLFVFDHPYYAKTNEKGEYEIPFVPAGAEVSLFAYHEGQGWVSQGSKDGEPFTIKAGPNVKDFTVKAPAQ